MSPSSAGRSAKHEVGEALKYEAAIDLSNENNSHTLLLLLTGKGKDVLEVGPAQGYMTRALRERGCRVTAIEVDPAAARLAEPWCDRMIIADIEQLNLRRTFRKKRFDVVVYGDVLEHLVNPERVLAETVSLLKPGGYVVASIPNVGHASVRLALLAGQFRYTDIGLLDNTHLRFFTGETVEDLFHKAGFRIRTWKRVVVDPFTTELHLRERDFPPRIVSDMRQDPEALVYQYVVKGEPDPSVRPRQRTRRKPKPGSAMARLGAHIAWLESQHTAKDHEIAHRGRMIAAIENSVAALQEAVGDRTKALRDLENGVVDLREAVADRDAVIADRDAAIADKEHRLSVALAQYEALTGTIGYRLLQRMRALVNRVAPEGTRRRSLVVAFGHGFEILLNRGFGSFLLSLVRFWRWIPRLFRAKTVEQVETLPSGPPEGLSFNEQYTLWLRANTTTPEGAATMRKDSAEFPYRPKISIVMPVFDTEPEALTAAIKSVEEQAYDRWELLIADDRSRRRPTRKVLRRSAKRDSRIRVRFLRKNEGIARASNAALELATGEFVTFLDHDDELKPEALFEVVKLLNGQQDLDVIYSDEDKRDVDTRLVEPFFKPDWSPDLLMSVNYVNHLSVYRREIVERLGGLRPEYEGSQDYDLVLRVAELTDRIEHIARPLYTWRKSPGSAAAAVNAKPFAYEAGRRALMDAVRRRGFEGEVVPSTVPGRYRVRYAIPSEPKVAIIIPTRDRLKLLQRCVGSIRKLSTYGNFEITIVDNRSEKPQTLKYLESFPHRVIRYPDEFNYARMMNVAAQEVDGDFLLFLNNDTEVISAEWIEALVEHAQRPEVAAVGARLLYPDGRPQHEGIIVGFAGGSAGNVDHGGFHALGETIRNCSAVTGACMMVRPQVYWELGGLEERLGVAFNDVDYCLRAREKGYQILYTPYALLYHHESATRGRLHPEENERFFRARWGDPGTYLDPYYNPNLDPLRPFRLRL